LAEKVKEVILSLLNQKITQKRLFLNRK